MSGRIERAFARAAKRKRAAFIPYLTAGDPRPGRTVGLLLALERAGADIVEVGVPYTDPIADGPVIQRACERALAHGVTVGTVLQMVQELRYTSELPLVVFSYYNPIHAYGLTRFAVDAAATGVDAVLLTDVPVEEAGPAAEALRRVDIDLVPLVAPTSTRKRIKAAKQVAGSFVYFVAQTGVTGPRNQLAPELETQVRVTRRLTGRKVAVGFGISSPEQAARVARFADGVVVGSAIVSRIEELGNSAELFDEIRAFCQPFADAMCRQTSRR